MDRSLVWEERAAILFPINFTIFLAFRHWLREDVPADGSIHENSGIKWTPMAPIEKEGSYPAEQDFARLVDLYYKGLYRFACTLTHNETEAYDLVQQAFYLWATHGGQLRDPAKVKSWLFTTLYREFLRTRRRQERFPHQSLDEAQTELPSIAPQVVNQMDWRTVVEAFGQVDEVYRAPLALFYLEDHSYQQIAEVLQIPIGTVMSRISRGRAQLQELLLRRKAEGRVIQFPTDTERGRRG